jgi:hypothetical protein
MTKTLDVSRASIRAEITTGSLTKISGFSRASSENKVAGGLVGAASGVVAWNSRHNVATINCRENNRNLLSGKGRLPRRGRGSDRMFWSEQIVFREGGSYAKKQHQVFVRTVGCRQVIGSSVARVSAVASVSGSNQSSQFLLRMGQ